MFFFEGFCVLEGVFLLGELNLILFLAAYDEVAEGGQAGAGGNQMAGDDVFLHAFEIIDTAADGSFVEHLGLRDGGRGA